MVSALPVLLTATLVPHRLNMWITVTGKNHYNAEFCLSIAIRFSFPVNDNSNIQRVGVTNITGELDASGCHMILLSVGLVGRGN